VPVLTRGELFGHMARKAGGLVTRAAGAGNAPQLSPVPVRLEPRFYDLRKGEYPPAQEFVPAPVSTDSPTCYRVLFSRDDDLSAGCTEDMLRGLHAGRGRWCFEVTRDREETFIEWAIEDGLFPHLESSLKGRMPGAVIQAVPDPIARVEDEGLVLEFVEPFPGPGVIGLITPVKEFSSPPLAVLLQVFSTLNEDELGFYQVIIEPCRNPGWHGNWELLADMEYLARTGAYPGLQGSLATQAVPSAYLPHVAERLRAKKHPEKKLFAVKIRVGGWLHPERKDAFLKGCASFLSQFNCGGRPFSIVGSGAYVTQLGADACREMVASRQSYTVGMLANSYEVAGLVCVPAPCEDEEPGMDAAGIFTSLPVPDEFRSGEYLLGHCRVGCERVPVGLPQSATPGGLMIPNGHLAVIGSTGTGKSSLLVSLIAQDIRREDCAVIVSSPHGDIFADIAAHMSDQDVERAVHVEPSNSGKVVALDMLAVGDRRNIGKLAEDAANALRGALPTWGANMQNLLRNVFVAMYALELPLSAARSLISLSKGSQVHDAFRARVIQELYELGYAESAEFWRRDYPKLGLRELNSTLNKLNLALLSRPMAAFFSLKRIKLTFREVMTGRLLCFLSNRVDVLGSEGSVFLSDLQLSTIKNCALSMLALPPEKRPSVRIYIDEAQRLGGPGVREMMEEVRKAGVDVIASYANLSALDEQALAAVRAVGAMVVFNAGASDYRKVKDRFFPRIKELDVARLERGKAYLSAGGRVACFETEVPGEARPDRLKRITSKSLAEYGVGRDEAQESDPRAMIRELKARGKGSAAGGGAPQRRRRTPKLF